MLYIYMYMSTNADKLLGRQNTYLWEVCFSHGDLKIFPGSRVQRIIQSLSCVRDTQKAEIKI